MRRIADINEMIDIMSSINGGAFATVCYISSAKVGKTLTGKGIDIDKFGADIDNNRSVGDDEIYNSLKNYQMGGASMKNKFPYGGIVKMSRYQFNWQTEENYDKNFSKYASARDKLLSRYGASMERGDSYDQKQSYGKGGISVGSTVNTAGKLYSHQNGATIKNAKYQYYVVDRDGDLKGGISYDAIRQIVAKSGSIDGVSALKKIGATDEQIKEYVSELKKLNFSVLKLSYDCILFIIASVNGEKVFFINENLAQMVGSGSYTVKINPQSFILKAKEIFNNEYNTLTENINNRVLNKKRIRLTEGDLRQMVMECVDRILKETRLDYDVDNFSGRWTKNVPDEEFNSEDYLDNPYMVPNSFDDDDWVDGDKGMENDYSWHHFDNKPIAHGIDDYYKISKGGVNNDVTDAISRNDRKQFWSDRELRNRDKVMDKYVRGIYDGDDVGDSFDDVKESIDIDPKNKGKFTATKKRTGKSTEELTHSKNPLTRKRAIFAQNAKKWKK